MTFPAGVCRRWTNDSESPQEDKILDGVIESKGFFIITNDAEGFQSIYGFSANQDIGSGGPADGNGDDDLALVNPDGNIVDFYGQGGGVIQVHLGNLRMAEQKEKVQ